MLDRSSGLWARDIPPCPFCGAGACYREDLGEISCDNLDNGCPVDPAVHGEPRELRGKWDRLRAAVLGGAE